MGTRTSIRPITKDSAQMTDVKRLRELDREKVITDDIITLNSLISRNHDRISEAKEKGDWWWAPKTIIWSTENELNKLYTDYQFLYYRAHQDLRIKEL